MTHSNTHTTHEYPLGRLAFADLVTAKLPLAQNAADIVAIINAYKVPFVQIQHRITIHVNISMQLGIPQPLKDQTPNPQEDGPCILRLRPHVLVCPHPSPNCSPICVPAHSHAQPSAAAHVLACTFLLLFAGHRNESRCTHRTSFDSTIRIKEHNHSCVHVL